MRKKVRKKTEMCWCVHQPLETRQFSVEKKTASMVLWSQRDEQTAQPFRNTIDQMH